MSSPSLSEVEKYKASDAVLVIRVGDLSLLRNEWPVIGNAPSWDRSEWPMAQFIRRDDLSRKAWRVFYADDDPSVVDRELADQYDSPLREDSVFGAGAAELVLTNILT